MADIRNIQQMYTINNLLNDVLHFGFTIFVKKMGKNKNENDPFYEEKNKRKTKQCYQYDICRWNRDSFSVFELKITRGIIWIKVFKNRILKKI